MKRAKLFSLLAMAFGLLVADVPAREDVAATVQTSRYAFAATGDVATYLPSHDPKGVVLFLSGEDGWTRDRDQMARALARKGLLVAGISTPALLQAMERSPRTCVNPNYPLIDLARDLQHRMAVETYRKPVLLGYGAGATLAYAAIALWPSGGYQAAVSINPATRLASRKQWCTAPGFSARRMTKPPRGWQFAPNRRITIPWVVVQQQPNAVIARRALLGFLSSVPHASLIDLPGNGNDPAGADQLAARTASAIGAVLPPPIPGAPAGEVPIPDMPLTLVPPMRGKPSDLMAIAYSGDGGWVGIDRDLANQIAAAGIPVVGVDSLSYFWSARTPEGAARDLGRLIRGFGARWNRRRVLLIGYSFGAGVLPYMIDKLDPDTRSRIASVSLLGLGATADFQFHLTSWLDMDSARALPTLPAVLRLRGIPLRCVRGELERDSACPALPAGLAGQFIVPGGHHFGRNAPLLGRIVLGQRRPGHVGR